MEVDNAAITSDECNQQWQSRRILWKSCEEVCRKADNSIFFNSRKSKVSGGKHLKPNRTPNSVKATGWIFHVGWPIRDRGSSGRAWDLVTCTRDPVLKKCPSAFFHPLSLIRTLLKWLEKQINIIVIDALDTAISTLSTVTLLKIMNCFY